MDAGLSREHGAEAAASLMAKRSLHQGFFATQNRLDSIHCLTGSAGRADHQLSSFLFDNDVAGGQNATLFTLDDVTNGVCAWLFW